MTETWEKIKDTLSTGDIVLFHGKSAFSRFVEYFTGSSYSHVAMVVKTPIKFTRPRLMNGYIYWESGEQPQQLEAPDNKVLGVQFSDLEKMVYTYDGGLYVRKLNWDLPEQDRKEILADLHHKVHNMPYDDHPLDWLKAYFKVQDNECRENSFYCSAFVGYLYTQLGLLSQDTKWDLLEPGFFSAQNNTLTLQMGASLGPEIQIN